MSTAKKVTTVIFLVLALAAGIGWGLMGAASVMIWFVILIFFWVLLAPDEPKTVTTVQYYEEHREHGEVYFQDDDTFQFVPRSQGDPTAPDEHPIYNVKAARSKTRGK